MATEFCPACGELRIGAFRFCRNCRFDFEAHPTPDAPTAIGPVSAATRSRRPSRRTTVAVVVAFLVVAGLANQPKPVPDTVGANPTQAAAVNLPHESTPLPSLETPTPQLPTPTVAPTPAPTPTPTPDPTPTPTPEPIIAFYDQVLTADSVDRAAFRGQAGSYTWETVTFPEELVIVRWDVTSLAGACSVTWQADAMAGNIAVASGDQVKGSKQFSTPFFSAEMVVESSCGKWLITMQGTEPAPTPTPRPPSNGGSNCHPSYEGACLKQGSGDYDCAGGSGNGPNYVAGPLYVVGHDEFDLDRDGDGVGCE